MGSYLGNIVCLVSPWQFCLRLFAETAHRDLSLVMRSSRQAWQLKGVRLGREPTARLGARLKSSSRRAPLSLSALSVRVSFMALFRRGVYRIPLKEGTTSGSLIVQPGHTTVRRCGRGTLLPKGVGVLQRHLGHSSMAEDPRVTHQQGTSSVATALGSQPGLEFLARQERFPTLPKPPAPVGVLPQHRLPGGWLRCSW